MLEDGLSVASDSLGSFFFGSLPPANNLFLVSASSTSGDSLNPNLHIEPEVTNMEALAEEFKGRFFYKHASGCDIRKLMDLIKGQTHVPFKPDVLHFVGHGQSLVRQTMPLAPGSQQLVVAHGEVPLELEQVDVYRGRTYGQLYNPDKLIATIHDANRHGKCRLVTLQCCKTAALAREICTRSPDAIVVCWGTLLLDNACAQFSRDFYSHLLESFAGGDEGREVGGGRGGGGGGGGASTLLTGPGKCLGEQVLLAFAFACESSRKRGFLLIDPEVRRSHVGPGGVVHKALGVPMLVAGSRVTCLSSIVGGVAFEGVEEGGRRVWWMMTGSP